MEWVLNLQSIIFSRVKNETTESLKKKYPEIRFTTSEKSETTPRFPNVLIKQIGSVEQGQTLDGTTVNGGLFTFQIDVYDNQSQNRARQVMGEIVRIMKSMRFSIVAMPEFESSDTHRCTARFRRVIGASDIL